MVFGQRCWDKATWTTGQGAEITLNGVLVELFRVYYVFCEKFLKNDVIDVMA